MQPWLQLGAQNRDLYLDSVVGDWVKITASVQ
jgi:hypothetical protein